MATYDELKLTHRLFMKSYPFKRYRIDPTPCAPLLKTLGETRFALVTSAGLHIPEQNGFDHSLKMGDVSFREIPNEVETATLVEAHKSDSFDHAGVTADRNLAFPLDRFRELERQGAIDSLNRRHFSFMGSILNPRGLIEETAPEIACRLKADGVDAVLLTPV